MTKQVSFLETQLQTKSAELDVNGFLQRSDQEANPELNPVSHEGQALAEAMAAKIKQEKQESHAKLGELARLDNAASKPRPFGISGSKPAFGVRAYRNNED
jgi:hypothetical protein